MLNKDWTFVWMEVKKLLLMEIFIHFTIFLVRIISHPSDQLPKDEFRTKTFLIFFTILEAILFHLISLFRFHFNPSVFALFRSHLRVSAFPIFFPCVSQLDRLQNSRLRFPIKKLCRTNISNILKWNFFWCERKSLSVSADPWGDFMINELNVETFGVCRETTEWRCRWMGKKWIKCEGKHTRRWKMIFNINCWNRVISV